MKNTLMVFNSFEDVSAVMLFLFSENSEYYDLANRSAGKFVNMSEEIEEEILYFLCDISLYQYRFNTPTLEDCIFVEDNFANKIAGYVVPSGELANSIEVTNVVHCGFAP